MKKDNPYRKQINEVLPRILALYDTDATGPTYGMGDRYRWAWKLIDFGNGTFQGAAHGLARLLVNDLLPQGISERSVMRRIHAMFRGAETLRDANGSLGEAFPFESSFCVTALVAYDLLSAVELLSDRLDETQRNDCIQVVHPMIDFLHHADESHALISNHLATASAALYKWSALTGHHGEERGYQLLSRILHAQSDEGWFREYEGADPGYQSLCTYYLADIHCMRPDLNLLEPLRRSIRFLWHFAHPDGSFGGHYGSRNTRFYYPAGIEALSTDIPEAASLAAFMRGSITSHTTVTLNTIDEPNLIPMFNAYCRAAASYEQASDVPSGSPAPALAEGTWQKSFPDAGLIVDKGDKHYTVVSVHKGGICYHYTDSSSVINTGVVAEAPNGKRYSTQAYFSDNEGQRDGNILTITAPLTEMNKQLPTPLQFILLRCLNITVMRSLTLGNWIKKALVKLLITGKKTTPVKNRRTIRLGADLAINDTWQGSNEGFRRLEVHHPFSAIHMASQGYWQKQDDSE